jgi:ABC-type uncharacterized transport system auxiliary subunit
MLFIQNSIKVTAIILALILTSCLSSLKNEYPDIKYYRLNQEPSTLKNQGKIKGVVQIRDFKLSNEIESDNITAQWNGDNVQKYYYHRWSTELSSLVTDFFVTRFNTNSYFSEGAVKSGSMIIPTYIVEGNILEMMAYSTDKKNDKTNYVSVSVNIYVLKRIPLKTDIGILFNKVYNIKIPRADNLVESIPAAFGKALSQLSDNMLYDLQQAIAKDQ